MHEFFDVALSWIAAFGRPGIAIVVFIWAYCSGLLDLADREGRRIVEQIFHPSVLMMTVVWTVVWGYAAPQGFLYLVSRVMKPNAGKIAFVVGFSLYFAWWFWTMMQTLTPFRRVLRKQRR